MTSPLLGPPVQIAYAVTDLDDAARRWATDVGAGPFFVRRHIALMHVRHRGRPALFDHSSAYGQGGAVMLELVQDHTAGASPVADVVGPGGCGLHHLAFFVDDIEQATRRLDAHGWPEALRAATPSGQEFAFHDGVAALGHMVEIYEPTPGLVAFYAMVAAAAVGWDGSQPVRVMA